MSKLPVVKPVPTPDDAPFWEAAAQGRLVLPRCRGCSIFIWYPRHFCSECNSFDVDWVDASGRGTVYSFTVNHRGGGPWAEVGPFVIAYVELEEGPRIMTNIVDCDPATVTVGQAVSAVWDDAGDTKVLRFAPS